MYSQDNLSHVRECVTFSVHGYNLLFLFSALDLGDQGGKMPVYNCIKCLKEVYMYEQLFNLHYTSRVYSISLVKIW